MALDGSIVNGHVQLDTPTNLPEGTRVRLVTEEAFEYPHPMAPYEHDQEEALLRGRLAEMDEGVPGLSIEEAMALVDAELERMTDRAED